MSTVFIAVFFYLAFPGFYIPHVRSVSLHDDNGGKVHVLIKELQKEEKIVVYQSHPCVWKITVTFADNYRLGGTCCIKKDEKTGNTNNPQHPLSNRIIKLSCHNKSSLKRSVTGSWPS